MEGVADLDFTATVNGCFPHGLAFEAVGSKPPDLHSGVLQSWTQLKTSYPASEEQAMEEQEDAVLFYMADICLLGGRCLTFLFLKVAPLSHRRNSWAEQPTQIHGSVGKI